MPGQLEQNRKTRAQGATFSTEHRRGFRKGRWLLSGWPTAVSTRTWVLMMAIARWARQRPVWICCWSECERCRMCRSSKLGRHNRLCNESRSPRRYQTRTTERPPVTSKIRHAERDIYDAYTSATHSLNGKRRKSRASKRRTIGKIIALHKTHSFIQHRVLVVSLSVVTKSSKVASHYASTRHILPAVVNPCSDAATHQFTVMISS